jgi:predicted amidohydrolase YtcJ
VHADLATPAQIERMRAVGAGFAVQPLIAEHTRAWAGCSWDRSAPPPPGRCTR